MMRLRVGLTVWTPQMERGVIDFIQQQGGDTFCVDLIRWPTADDMRNWHGDGLIGRMSVPMLAESARQQGLRIVNVSGWWESPEHPTVTCDDEAVGRLGGEHLLGKGLQNFAYVGPRQIAYSCKRERGFFSTVGRVASCYRRLTVKNQWYRLPDAPMIRHRLNAWLTALPKPVGLMASNDDVAWQIAEECRINNIRIPAEVALLGVNNEQLRCQSATPPLSSVDCAHRRIGFEAAALMHRLLNGEPPPAEPIRVSPIGVVQRQSTDLLAVQDEVISAALCFIRDNAHKPVSVEEIAASLGVGRRALERRFAAFIGHSPGRELRRVRIERVEQLLLETDRSLDDIAFRCGFAYPAQLYKAFRTTTGMTPSQYRKRFRRR